MTNLPPLMKKDLIRDGVLIPVLSIMQAIAMGVAAFATRDAFSALHQKQGQDIVVLLTLLTAGLAVAVLGWLIKQRAEAMGQSYANALRITLYRHIAGMNLSALEQRRVGALSLRFVGDLSAARNWFGRGLPLAISAAFVLPGAGLMLWQLDPQLAVAGLAPLYLVIILTLSLAVGLERRHRTLRRRRANISIAMIERIAVAPLLDLMGRTKKELRNLNQTGRALRKNALERTAQRNGLSGLVDFGAAFAGVAMLFTAGQQGIDPGLVAAALAMIAILVTPLRELALVWDRYCGWRVAREKALNLLNQPSENRDAKGGHDPAFICVRGPVTFDLSPGQIHHISSDNHPSGLNILRIIAGLDRNDDVMVRFRGTSNPPAIAYLSEKPAILQGSLRRAATLGLHPRPKDDQIHAMLTAFGLADLAVSDKGLRNRVSEGGRNLPPADRFRLELVRLALSKPGLVLVEGIRLHDDPDVISLIKMLHEMLETTIVINGDPNHSISSQAETTTQVAAQ